MSQENVLPSAPPQRVRRRHFVLGGILLAIVALVLLFDWNWFRGPLERYVSQKTQREFRISDLDVDLGWTPNIKLKDVYFANAPWSASGTPMAKIGSLEFTVSLRDLWDRKVRVPRAALSQAVLVFEKAKDGRKNWVLQEPSETQEPSRFRINSLSVDKGTLRYQDHGEPLIVDIQASTFEPQAAAKSADATAKPDNARYTTRYAYQGKYHDAAFSGEALTGDVLSFQDSDIPFPIKGGLRAGTTRLDVEGTVADVTDISAVDARIQISGQTLAGLYPFLLLPLPASPPYQFRGHLKQQGDRYSIDDLLGKIGSTDVSGSGAYVRREPRPLLTAKLQSKMLDIADLGPIIGLETKDTPAAAPPKQAETLTRPQAQAKERAQAGDKILPTGTVAAKGDGILPSGKFEGGRLRAIDAEVDFAAAQLKAPSGLAVEDMRFAFRLHDAVAKLEPLEFGFAGGRIVSVITIDARQEKALRTTLNADFRQIQIAELFPALPQAAQGVGALGARIRLQGTGNSIAEAAAAANGSASAAVSQGRLSNLIDAIAGLNGGKILMLLVGGDKDIALNCGAAAFDVKDGVGRSQLFVVDTAQTRIDGSGSFDLRDEQMDFTIEPKPKRPGILSLRAPLHVRGSFRHPEAGVDKGVIATRLGAATALALVNPLAALLPLLETGPGTDTDCAAALAPVQAAKSQINAKIQPLPKPAVESARR